MFSNINNKYPKIKFILLKERFKKTKKGNSILTSTLYVLTVLLNIIKKINHKIC